MKDKESWTVGDLQEQYICIKKWDGYYQPKFEIFVSKELKINIRYYGWRGVSHEMNECNHVSATTVCEILKQITGLKVCRGVDEECVSDETICHKIQAKEELPAILNPPIYKSK